MWGGEVVGQLHGIGGEDIDKVPFDLCLQRIMFGTSGLTLDWPLERMSCNDAEDQELVVSAAVLWIYVSCVFTLPLKNTEAISVLPKLAKCVRVVLT